MSGISQTVAAEALRAELEALEKLPGAQPRLAERLTRFVLTGEGESVVAEVAAMKNTHLALVMTSTHHDLQNQKGLSVLVNRIPQDPETFLRLAKVYDAAQQAGMGVAYIFGAPTIPAFHGSLSWLGTFLIEVSQGGKQRDPIFPVSLVLGMIEASGDDPGVLVRGLFFYEDPQGKGQLTRWNAPPYSCFHCLDHFDEFVSSSADLVRPAFHQKEAGNRATVLRAMLALRLSPAPFVEEIASLAVSGSKEVRENAGPLVSEHYSLFKEPLQRVATKGSADERFHAVRLLARLGGAGERQFLTDRLESEKSEKVREALREAFATAPSEQATPVEEDYKLPVVPEVPVFAPLDKQFLAELREMVEGIESATALQFARYQSAQQFGLTRTPVSPEAADRLFEALQSFVVKDRDLRHLFNGSNVDAMLLQNYHIPEHFQLIHVVRWCLLLSEEPVDPNGKLSRWQLNYRWSHPLLSYQKVQKTQIDLRELAAIFKTIGLDDNAIGRSILHTNWSEYSAFGGSDPNVFWPYFAERLQLLEEALGLRPVEERDHYTEQTERQNAFRILKALPHLPAGFISPLWEIALGNSKTERRLAQETLENFPNKEQKLIAALAGRQQDARIAAAQWLTTLGYKEAIPALKAALAKEKSDIVKDELMKALESMGVPLDELVDLEQLDAEAEKGLKKGIPDDLDWFPFSQLPPVAWADSAKPVPPAIVQWFIVQGYKLKTAEASPALRRYCSLFQKEDREKLGRFILEAWIASDTKPKYTADQASAEAQRIAQQTAAYAKQYPQYYPDFSEERLYQSQFNWLVIQPDGSQTNTKGTLAVAGACCGPDAAPIVHRYVKQWYGYRSAQCKALLQVLAWIDHPSATQVVLSVANRFRTKGIQEEAMRQCQLLAERKGWTMDELADRTIPTVGFDEAGVMELDYGVRKFTASLSEEMTITLTNQNGKVIASLPDANQSDDAEKFAQAKSALSNARKELKSILSMQKDRLYESMCTQRTWCFEDWDTYLRQHPIVGRYCQRLVWVAYEGNKIVASFRPLPDGTLSNHQDDEVKLTPETEIRLGHDETLPEEDRTAWLEHFSDYQVEPLFQQFGKQKFALPSEMKDATEIKDFLGHIVKAFSLRNRLTRLGYTRGPTEDAGWFYSYHKTFLRLGIESVIEFTGNPLPEENRTVALQRLYFTRKLSQNPLAMTNELPLGEIPPVLLTECWNDIRMAAADGTGFAADWEKQAEY